MRFVIALIALAAFTVPAWSADPAPKAAAPVVQTGHYETQKYGRFGLRTRTVFVLNAPLPTAPAPQVTPATAAPVACAGGSCAPSESFRFFWRRR